MELTTPGIIEPWRKGPKLSLNSHEIVTKSNIAATIWVVNMGKPLSSIDVDIGLARKPKKLITLKKLLNNLPNHVSRLGYFYPNQK